MMKRRFKAVIDINGDTFVDAAKKMGMSASTLSRKVNGKVPFTQTEIQTFKDAYGLSMDEMANVFFKEKVA